MTAILVNKAQNYKIFSVYEKSTGETPARNLPRPDFEAISVFDKHKIEIAAPNCPEPSKDMYILVCKSYIFNT